MIRHKSLGALGRSAKPVSGESEGNVDGIEKNAEFREALSLAALAARAKGVELSPEALMEYARALFRGREAAPSTDREGDPAEGDSAEEEEADFTAGNGEPDKKPENGDAKRGKALRERVLGTQGPLLSLLNSLPGKGGKHWIVLPFSAGGSLECCLRILLVPRTGPAAYRAERLSLDIRRREEPGPAWIFTFRLNTADPAGARPLSLDVFCRQTRAGTKFLERELAELLGLPPDSVRVQNGHTPVFAEDCRDWTLPSLNKEV
jgi:hypothetical protein